MAIRTPQRRHLAAMMISTAVTMLLPLLSGCTIGSGIGAAVETGEPAATSEAAAPEEAISILYALTADSGTLTPTGNSASEFTLTLSAADAHTIWFTDRPAHAAGTLTTSEFVREWADFGFADMPPNIAIVLHTAAHENDTLIAELLEPSFDDSTGTFTALVIVESDSTGSAGATTFEHFAATKDASLPESFSGVSLFINDSSGRVVDGCIVAPHVTC